jgi:dolichol-phosphate mannosyltransferase
MLSIIIPTYNESQNILQLLDKIRSNSSKLKCDVEIVVVDDNSPDGTGTLVEEYARRNSTNVTAVIKSKAADYRNEHSHESKNNNHCLVKVIHRNDKYGLVSAILQGVHGSIGQYILVMDADFSHSPEVIPIMIKEIQNSDYDIVVGSRYTKGGSVKGWPFRRRLISTAATKIAQYVLNVTTKDPMSGFFICKCRVLEDININTGGYKILLEILVKKQGIKVKEVPYTFLNRKLGKSKLDINVVTDYLKAVWTLYRYGHRSRQAFQLRYARKSISFLSKAGRFYTVGASGLLINYAISSSLQNGLLANISYIIATVVGIICSITSNFLLNKIWTFEDRDFSLRHTLKQYGLFAGISSAGALIQLLFVYLLTGDAGWRYEASLFIAVTIASVSNYLLNKRWTFQEDIWG